jgi:hypothetical protein
MALEGNRAKARFAVFGEESGEISAAIAVDTMWNSASR